MDIPSQLVPRVGRKGDAAVCLGEAARKAGVCSVEKCSHLVRLQRGRHLYHAQAKSTAKQLEPRPTAHVSAKDDRKVSAALVWRVCHEHVDGALDEGVVGSKAIYRTTREWRVGIRRVGCQQNHTSGTRLESALTGLVDEQDATQGELQLCSGLLLRLAHGRALKVRRFYLDALPFGQEAART